LDHTTLLGLNKPSEDDEPFARSTVNDNSDSIDNTLIMFLFGGIPFANYHKDAMILDGDGMPQSQAFTGPNGLVGTTVYVYTANTCTTTISVTTPAASAGSMTITTDLDDFEEDGVSS